jgi:putative aldouronate transport system permease protein
LIQGKRDRVADVVLKLYLLLMAVFCLFPILMAVGVSFTAETEVTRNGYALIPRVFSADAYAYLFETSARRIGRSYLVTICVTAAGTVLALAITALYAYALSVRSFKARNIFSLIAYFTMIFSAGMLPWYLVCVNYYRLSNSYLALILPACFNVWYCFLMRNFFQSVPHEITEAATIDGAGHLIIFARIILPTAKVGLSSIALFYALSFWNDWYLALMFIKKQEMQPLQFMLYNVLSNAQFFASESASRLNIDFVVPRETVKMAITCVTIGPIVFLYPFIQRFFVRGITVGGVKG